MENINLKNAQEVVEYMANACNLYEPLKQAFNDILANTQFVDITELKGNIEKLTAENEELKKKAEAYVVLENQNKEQKELLSNLGKQLVSEKLTRAKNEESLNVLGKQLVEIKLSLKGDK